MATYWENSCSFGLRYVSWYKCLIVSLVFSHLGFWSGNLFLIAPFPDLCLLVPFQHNRIISAYTQLKFSKLHGLAVNFMQLILNQIAMALIYKTVPYSKMLVYTYLLRSTSPNVPQEQTHKCYEQSRTHLKFSKR